MTPKMYLYIISQILTCGYVKTSVNGRIIQIKKDQTTNRLALSSQVTSENTIDQRVVKECFSTNCKARFTNTGSYLVQKNSSINEVFIEQEILPIFKYRFFSALVKQFLEEAQDWDEILSTKS